VGVSSPYALTAIQATLQAYLLHFSTRNFSLRLRFASRFAMSSGMLTPRDTLRAYLRPCAKERA
jgi:hypothetical protein